MRAGIGRCLAAGAVAAAFLAGAAAVSAVAAPAAQDPLRRPLEGAQGVAWRPGSGEIWVLCEDGERVRVFDVFLRERASAPDPADFPAGGGLRVPAWGGRELILDPAAGVLQLGRAPWERAPEVAWGPGWGVVELRAARPLEALEWRRAGDAEVHRVPFVTQRRDGLERRAWIEDVVAGERLELRYPPLPAHPPRRWSAWITVEVPPVDPAGERPRVPLTAAAGASR